MSTATSSIYRNLRSAISPETTQMRDHIPVFRRYIPPVLQQITAVMRTSPTDDCAFPQFSLVYACRIMPPTCTFNPLQEHPLLSHPLKLLVPILANQVSNIAGGRLKTTLPAAMSSRFPTSHWSSVPSWSQNLAHSCSPTWRTTGTPPNFEMLPQFSGPSLSQDTIHYRAAVPGCPPHPTWSTCSNGRGSGGLSALQ